MTIEQARVVAHPKPWGVADVGPWSGLKCGATLIGELSYQRADATAPTTGLLLKLLFTSAPLSIQVHPDDSYARSIGLSNGKSEAWYVLDAAPDAKVALGLEAALTRDQLREAIGNFTIAKRVRWQSVNVHDVISIPAGTIHAIGAGLVIAEIQQRSNATFRLFDHGRDRELHVTDGTAAAILGTAELPTPSQKLSDERLLLTSNAHFVFERIALQPGSAWRLDASRETWLLAVDGDGRAGPCHLTRGRAIYARGEPVTLEAGGSGMDCLVAYDGSGGPLPTLLHRIATPKASCASQATKDNAQPRMIGTSP